jgi:hypothetical protein
MDAPKRWDREKAGETVLEVTVRVGDVVGLAGASGSEEAEGEVARRSLVEQAQDGRDGHCSPFGR